MSEPQELKEVSTVEQVFEAARQASAEIVRMPSGLTFKLVKPSLFGSYTICRQALKLVSAITSLTPDQDAEPALYNYIGWLEGLFAWAFVSPRFSAEPRPGEIGLPNILLEDQAFIVRWLGHPPESDQKSLQRLM